MSKLRVTPDHLAHASAHIGGVSPAIDDLHAGLAGCRGAAAGTGAHGAVEGMLGRWAQALPQFGLAAEHLAAAVAAAGSDYARSDGHVAAACRPEDRGARTR